MPRPCFVACLALLLVVAACDGTPVDPLDASRDVAALLGPGAQPLPAHSLEALLHAAVHRVHVEQGRGAARTLVGQLRRLQDAERNAAVAAAADSDGAAAAVPNVRAEQVAIILGVFGDGVVDRVRAGVALDAARLQRGVDELEAAGQPMANARELLAEVDDMVRVADRAAAAGDHAAALDAAARAAAGAEAVRAGMAAANRIPALAELFDLSMSRIDAANGAAPADVSRYRALRDAADVAVRGSDRERAQQALQSVRAEQIRIVLEVLGVEAAERLVDAVRTSVAVTEDDIVRESTAGRDLERLGRMAATARDMGHRAAAALAAGDAATALDLASHAAGLVNAARVALAYR